MKLKNSILVSIFSMMVGFIPLANKTNDIKYVIYADSLSVANNIKEELIVFYKEHCYSSLFDSIDKKLDETISSFHYESVYEGNTIYINYGDKIKMVGYLYQSNPPSFKFKYYFSASTYSIPEAISTSVATLSLSE
jgi:hypothetical protein